MIFAFMPLSLLAGWVELSGDFIILFCHKVSKAAVCCMPFKQGWVHKACYLGDKEAFSLQEDSSGMLLLKHKWQEL